MCHSTRIDPRCYVNIGGCFKEWCCIKREDVCIQCAADPMTWQQMKQRIRDLEQRLAALEHK
jgi:hypothetical protein